MENTLKLKIIDKCRPIVKLQGNKIFNCLFDTGADTCVFTRGSEQLLEIFPNAKERTDVKIILGGFGKEPEIVKVYTISELVIRDTYSVDKSVTFKNVDVACCYRDMRSDLIISASILLKVDYNIHNRIVSDRHIELICDDDVYHCNSLVQVVNDKLTVVTGVSVFAERK
jgi:hypothetical protein